MTERIFKSIISATTFALVVCFTLIVGIMYNHFEDEAYSRLKTEADYLSTASEIFGIDYLSQLTKEQRITLIDVDGVVLFDNQFDEDLMTNHLQREEVQEAILNGIGKGERLSETINTKTLYYAIRLENGQILRIADSQGTIWNLMFRMIQPMLIILIGAFLVAWIIAKKLSKQITKPINELDLDHPENNEAYLELEPLLTRIYLQKKRINEQIQEAKQKQIEFKMITDHMDEGFVVIGKDLSILSYNESIREHLDINVDITNENVYILNHEKKFIDLIEKTIQGNHGEWIQEKDQHFYQWIANPVLTDDSVGGAIIVVMDVTEKIKNDNYRREFSANISHELKTPLTSISGFAEIIQNGIVRQEDVQMFAGDIYKESQRLIHLVNDIIRISQLDDTSLVYQKETLSIKEEILEIVNVVSHIAKKKNVSMKVIGDDFDISVASSVFREVIYNLVDNAVKYNKDNGEVMITFTKSDDICTICVKDTGIGIPIQDQQHIFERFYRVDKSRSSQNGGTGLGLSIVKHGIITLNGSVDVKSTLHEGTEITIQIPIN